MFFLEEFKCNAIDNGEVEEQLLNKIADRVKELLNKDPDLLISYFYRLDISEKKIQQCLRSDNPVNNLAVAIYERQLERIQTKNNIRVDHDIDPNLKW